jgi:hypothetical protein
MTSKGGQFAGMMEAQSKTTSGLFSTLKDTFNEVFLTLGQPINDALRPLIEQAIGLVAKLTPMAAEAGKRIKEAVQFVIAVFHNGQALNLITSSLQLGFAAGINALVSGFRYAVSFFWHLLTDGAMWKSLGVTLFGVAAGFGAALLDAFNTPIVYLQAGMEWVVATLLKGLLKIPGMDELFGFDSSAVDSDWGTNLNSRREAGGDLFGIRPKEIAAAAAEIISGSAPALGDSIAAAAKKAGEFGGSNLIDTTRMKESLDGIIASMPGIVPESEAVKAAGKSAGKSGAATTTGQVAARLEPIVTSLGKVGGGGYSTGTLDAQRENNRLTGETNAHLKDIKDRLPRGGWGGAVAAFG